MTPKFASAGIILALVLCTGCGPRSENKSSAAAAKPATVELVKESERSRSFQAVNQHLELGGTLYGYVDIDGDVQKLANALKEMLTQISDAQPKVKPFAEQDYVALATKLGLTDIKAFGLSSVPDGTGFFRNRAFFYTPEKRHGMLLGLGGAPAPFKHLNLAPANTDLYAEAEVDVAVVYQTIKEVVAQVAGEPVGNRMEETLKRAGEKAALSLLELIHGLKGRAVIVARVDATASVKVPAPMPLSIPSFSMLLCVEGVAPAIEPALTKSPIFRRTEEGTLRVYEFTQPSPLEGFQPVIVADGSTLFIATNRAFLDECRSGKGGLAQTPDFQQSLARLGNEGNGLVYAHPRLFDGMRRLATLNPDLPPPVKRVIGNIMRQVPQVDRPLVAIRSNLPDGILVRSYLNRSMKQDVAAVAVYNPVTMGVMAAMAIPAFQKVRSSSQEKAVLNNLRQLGAAADQYYLETGKTTATYDDLVGPEKYIRQLNPVAGEDYRKVQLESGKPLQVRLRGGKTVKYQP